MKICEIILLIAIGMIVCGLTYYCGYVHARQDSRREAIQIGHAVWASDKQGKIEFRWKKLNNE